MTTETKTYTDGTTATGTAPLPDQSPAQQDAANEALSKDHQVASVEKQVKDQVGQNATDAAEHTELLNQNVSGLNDTIASIAGNVNSLANQHPNDVAELDRQVSQAHGILSGVHHRIRELLGLQENKTA